MRRWSLALLFTLASPALSQAPEAAATDTAPAPSAPELKAPPAAPAEEAKAPPAAPSEEPRPPPPAAPAAEAKAPPAAPAAEPKAPQAASPSGAKAAPAPAAEARPSPPAPSAEAKAPPAAPVSPAPEKPSVAQPAPPPPRVPAAPEAPGKSEELDPEQYARRQVKSEARYILESLIAGDVRGAAAELLYPFQLEDRKYATAEELVATWVKQLWQKRTDLITLYDIEVLSVAEMEKKYGKAPARLGLGSLREPNTYVAVGNLSGRAAVLLFRASPGSFPRAFAYTD